MSKEKLKRKIRRAAAAAAALALAVSFTFPAGTDMSGISFGNAIVASAEESGTCGDNLTWTLDDAGKLTISGSGTMYDWDNPNDVPWNSSREYITSVVINDGVTSIGKSAFPDCTSLTSITIPDGVTSIGGIAFASCTNLTSITIPDSVIYIGNNAFLNCTSLTSITIPNNVNYFGDYVFCYCSNLGSVFLPSSLSFTSEEIPVTATTGKYTVSGDTVTITEVITGYEKTYVVIPETIYGKTVVINDGVSFGALTQIKYTVADGKVTVTGVTLGNGQTSVSIPSAIDGKTVTVVFIENGTTVTAPDTAVQVKYTVTDNKVTITEMTNVSEGQKVDIPEKIGGYPVVSVAGAYQQYVGNHTHYFSNNICGLCSGAEYVTGITVSPDTLSFTVGDPASQLTAAVVPANAVDTSVEWTSSDTLVATVDDSGKVTAVGKGTATITATAKDGSGIYGECAVTVKETPTVTAPTASTAVDYGKTLADAGLTAGWTWENEDTVAQPANTYTAYKELTDDDIYNYNGLSGFTYDATNHKLSCEVPVIVNSVAPVITITASPDSAITGRETTVTVTVTAKNPNNDTLTDVPSPAISYKIGDGTEISIQNNGSFVIPADTPNGTVVTITATTAGAAQYNAKTDTKQILVSDCTHANVPTVWKTDETYHWHECTDCGEKVDKAEHIEDSGTVTTEPTETTAGVKTFKCVTCEYVMRTETISPITPEHTHSYGTEWKTDSTSHWHECSCGDKADIGQHISDNGKVTKQAASYCEGEITYSCKVCGKVLKTEMIPMKVDPIVMGSFCNSYIYSYDSDMNRITVNRTRKQGTITVDLGKEYAGKSFVLYEGKKSTKVKVTEGTLDKNGKFTLEVENGNNYTLVVLD